MTTYILNVHVCKVEFIIWQRNEGLLCYTSVFCFVFSIRLLLVLHDHSFFFIPATTANDLRLRRISIPDFINEIFCPIFILQKEPVFPSLMLSAKQGNYWYHFYNVFGMTRSLTGDWTWDLPHSMPALYH